MSPRPNRVAVIGDVHACDRRLDLLLTHLDERELDLVACVGDLVDGPATRTLRRPFCAHALDELAPETVRYLWELPASVDITMLAHRCIERSKTERP